MHICIAYFVTLAMVYKFKNSFDRKCILKCLYSYTACLSSLFRDTLFRDKVLVVGDRYPIRMHDSPFANPFKGCILKWRDLNVHTCLISETF